ncbi:MAG: InlB B-repeat-containing protein [Paludibacteraceae bacterium]|nr:InlB B-repeat-containing protein [Paludibacteraceae bacterium]
MKDKILSFAGMGIKGRSSSDPLITHLSPTNHPLLQKAWKYTTCMLLALLLGVGNMWAADPDYESYDWTSEQCKAQVGTHGKVIISGNIGTSDGSKVSSTHYAFDVKANLDASATTWNTAGSHIGIASSAGKIDSISFLWCPNGTNATQFAWIAWEKGVTPARDNVKNENYKGLGTSYTASKSWDEAKWETFDFTSIDAYTIYFSRSMRKFRLTGSSSDISNFGGGQTINVLGIRVWLHPSGYSITYECDGAETGCPTTNPVTGQTALPNPLPTVTKTGYNFDNWYTDSEKTQAATPGATINANTTLYANWINASTPTHAIAYNSESLKGANVSGYPTEYYEGTGIASFDALDDVENFHFNGWNPSSIGDDAITDIEVVATWVAAYDVTFSAGAGSGTVPAKFQKWEGAKFELPGQGEMVAPSGKAFDGWKANGTGDKLAAGAEYTMSNAAVAFVAQWKATPTVLFHWRADAGTLTTDSGNGTTTGGTTTLRSTDTGKTWSSENPTYDATVPADMKATSTKELKSGGNALYLELSLASGTFQEGDTIYVTGYKPWGFTTTTESINTLSTWSVAEVSTGSNASDVKTGYAVIGAGIDAATIYARRKEGSGSGIAAIKVIRPAAREIASTVITLSDVKVNDVSISAANLATLTTNHTLALTEEFAEAPVIKFNEHTVITYTEGEPATKTTDKVYTVTATVNGDGKWQAQQTINEVAYTVTAEKVSAATVTYYDGTTKLGDEVVGVGGSPADYADYQDKDFATFVGWYSNADLADEHAIADITALIVTKDTTLYGKWTPAYASSINIEQWVLDNGAGKGNNKVAEQTSAFIAVLEGLNYKCADLNELDSLTDAKNDGDRNEPFLGIKWKKASSQISFLLKSGSTVRVKLGNIGSGVDLIINEEAAVAKDASFEYENTTGSDVKVTFKGKGTATVVFKQIMIDEAIAEVKLPANVTIDANGGTYAGETSLKYTGTPLVIGNATPADAENYLFDGWYDGETKINAAAYEPARNVTLVAKYVLKPSPFSLTALTYRVGTGAATPVGYEEGTYTYNVELPYAKSYDAITVAATLKELTSEIKAGAVLNVTNVPGTATFTVVNTLDDSEQTYTVNFKKGAKDGVEIIRATHTGAQTADVTGSIGGEADKNTEGGGKLGGADNFFGIKLAEGTFQSGDILKIHATSSSAAVRIYSDKGTNRINAEDGVFEEGLFTYTLTSATEWIYLYRKTKEGETDMNPTVDYMAVYRPMDPVLTAIKFNDTEVAVTGTTVAATLPHGTDLSTMSVTPTIAWNGAGTAEVTGSWAWGANTFTVTDKDGDATVYTITLTEDVEKFTVTYYDGSTELGTEQVEVNGHPTAAEIVAPKKLGKTFQGWSESDGGDVVALNTITRTEAGTVKLYAKYEAVVCPTSGTIFSMVPVANDLSSDYQPTGTEEVSISEYANIANGEVYICSNGTDKRVKIVKETSVIQLIGGENGYIHVLLECPLKENDIIRFDNNESLIIAYNSLKTNSVTIAKTEHELIVPATWDDKNEFYIWRNGNNATISSIEVYRRPALTGASLENLTMRVGLPKTPVLHLLPSEDAIVTSQTWEIVGDPENLTDASINATTGEITSGTLNNTEENGTISVKVTLNGGIEATCTVTVVNAITQQNVEKSTLWDWTKAGSTEIKLTDSSDPKKTEEFVMANVAVNNDADFESDKLVVQGEYILREPNKTGYFQGNIISFKTTDEGLLKVNFSGNNDNSRVLKVYDNDGNVVAEWAYNSADKQNQQVKVPAGAVTLKAFEGEKLTNVRIYKIEFLTLEQRRTYSWIKPGELGTVCLKNDAVAVGADIYELQGPNEYGKLVFDQIEDNKIEAGKPYVFSATATGEISFYTQVNADHTDDAGNTKGMYGTFSNKTFNPETDQNIYYFSGHAIYGVKNWSSTVTIPAYLCYLNMVEFKASPAPSANPVPGRRRIVFDVQGEQTATGIGDVQGDEVQSSKVLINGQLFILRGEKMYDATGRLVK